MDATPHTESTTTIHDDATALEYVLHHVKGASPSSVTPLQLDELTEEQ